MKSEPHKKAACLVCRRSRIKCDWPSDADQCQRCKQIDAKCIRGELRPGRRKGIRNKRTGLDKAVFQIEQAVERARSTQDSNSEDTEILARLQTLLSDAASNETKSSNAALLAHHDNNKSAWTTPVTHISDYHSLSTGTPQLDSTIESAEDPLQLLACAKDTARNQNAYGPTTEPRKSGLDICFAPAEVNLDIGDNIDPIHLGLVSEEEAEAMFSFFYSTLSHTRWGLDSRVYTMPFTRSRSAFLFTSVMAASALFMPLAGALHKRLSTHAKLLASNIILHRHKSVEIVLAFMMNTPWMSPGIQGTHDDTCFYVSCATTIAIDLSLQKILVTGEGLASNARRTLSRGESLDVKKALLLDGFPDTGPDSIRGRMLLRQRERCWVALFVLDRGVCLARGRPSTFPVTEFIKTCDDWYQSSLADIQDGHLASIASLRRDLDTLLDDVRSFCDGPFNRVSDGSATAQAIQNAIDHFFGRWHAKWDHIIGTGPNMVLPPYVNILVTHTRLSIYAGVINHPTAALEVRQFFRTAGLSSALGVMRTAVQGETQLLSMPNNTAIMISFAACFALLLTSQITGESLLAPSIRELIEQTAGVLERIGSVTPHREGPSILYGRYLRQVLSTSSSALEVPSTTTRMNDSCSGPQSQSADVTLQSQPIATNDPSVWSTGFQFSEMSDSEIAQLLAGNEIDELIQGMAWDDMSTFDLPQWPEIF